MRVVTCLVWPCINTIGTKFHSLKCTYLRAEEKISLLNIKLLMERGR